MSNKMVTVIIAAKNKLAGGLADAGSSIKKFGTTLSGIFRAALGPVAVITGALVALKKAFEFVSEWAGRAGKNIREIQNENANRAVASLAKSYDHLTESIKQNEQALSDSLNKRKEAITSARAMADALNAVSRAQALAAIAPGDKDGRARVMAEFAAADAAKNTQRTIQDLSEEYSKLKRQSEVKGKSASDIDAQIKSQTKELIKQIAASQRLAAEADKMTKGGRGFGRAVMGKDAEEFIELSKQAAERAQALTAQIKKGRDARAEAIRDQMNMESQADELNTRIRAAQIQGIADQVELQTAEKAKAAAEIIKKEKELTEAQKKLVQELADVENAAAKERAKVAIDALAKAQAKREEVSKKTVDMVLEEQRAQQEAAAQWERSQNKARQLRQRQDAGAKLSKQQQEWLAAFAQIEKAKGGVQVGAQAVQHAKDQLAMLNDNGKKLGDIKLELEKTRKDLGALLMRA